MSTVKKSLPWADITINTNTGRIFLQQRWLYLWQTRPGVSAWTRDQKSRFHNAADTQIWAYWSNKINLRTSGNADFCRKFRSVRIDFDIRWVTTNEHWKVNVTKLPRGSTPTTMISNVDSANLTVNLDSADLEKYRPCNAANRCRDFKAVPHEFGHTIPRNPDEYRAGHPNLHDTDSIMNIGDQIRSRHLSSILVELNTMIPGCRFSHP